MAHKGFVSIIIDEVALEGLDGITLQALWLRLEDRNEFCLKPVVDKVKRLVWNILTKANCLEFFMLPNPRKPLIIYNRLTYVDNAGNHLELPNLDIYPHAPITDEVHGIMGSCSDYETRVNITEEATSCTIDEAISKWGNKLVIVADQKTRKNALCGVSISPLIELNINNYCLLERVGRGRRNGEVTQGKFGLQLISSDSKMLFYYRKCLLKLNLVTVQSFYLRIKNQNCIGKLVHLKRFSVEVKTKLASDADKIIEHLKNLPGRFMPYSDVCLLDLKVDVKKILQKSKVLRSENVPYRVVYPKAPTFEWRIKSNGREKVIRIVRLIECETSEGILDDEEEDEEDEKSGLLDESKREVGRPLVRQGYTVVERSHIMGMSQTNMGNELGITSLQSRSICKLLKKYKLCGTMLSDVGRQRVTLFYCKKFETLKHSMSSAVEDEKNKLLQIINSEHCINTPSSIKRREKPKVTGSLSKTPVKEYRTNTAVAPEEGNSKNLDTSTDKVTPKKASKEEDEAIETEITVSEPGNSEVKSFPSLTDSNSPEGSGSNLTLRILKRASLILQAVNALRVIQDPQKIQRMINEEEEMEGFNYSIDRKTVLRLIEKLKGDGHVKVIKVTLRGYGKEKNLTFVCHPSVTPENSEIQSAIEQVKMKLPILTREIINKSVDSSAIKERLIHDQKVGRLQYGYKPKFVRLRSMHFFMYYLVYAYNGDTNLDQETVKRDMIRKYQLDESFMDEMGPVYQDEVNWKMFIPPLPSHEEFPAGWCLVSDLLLRLPLFMFLNLVNISYKIPNIQDYLDHPIRKYYLVKDLPSEISNHLTIMRKYIFTISDIVSQLAYIGLVQYGPQILKEKDQVFVYLNRFGMLVDTTLSEEGYNHISTDREYPEKLYEFKSPQHVEAYWGDLWHYAMNTRLGNRLSMTGMPVVIESVVTKKLMVETLKAKTPSEADTLDSGYLPGDRLGAAGLDSDLFVHLKRNWYWANGAKGACRDKELGFVFDINIDRNEPNDILRRCLNRKSKPVTRFTDEDPDYCPAPRKIRKVEGSLISHRFGKEKIEIDIPEVTKTLVISDPNFSEADEFGNATFVKKTGSGKPRVKIHKKITRIILPRAKVPKKPYYDQKDQEALTRMKKLRVDWSPAEDNVLLLCKVASLFMCPYKIRKVMKNFTVVREILHKQLPEVSLNKTSRACQRRISYMMKSQSSVSSVDICLEELRQDEDLVATFGPDAVIKMQQQCKSEKNSLLIFKKKYDELFTEFVNILLMRLKSVSDIKTVLEGSFIPDSITELYNKYNVVIPAGNNTSGSDKYYEVQNNVDIMCSVVNSVIHSSLAGLMDKTCYSYQLLHIYQQYPDKLLRSVMAKCRNMSIVSLKKSTKQLKRFNDTCLPLSSSPYQLSQSYHNMLQVRFQYPIFYNSFRGFYNMMNNHSENSYDVDIQNGGECANVVELYSSGNLNLDIKLPEQVIILDPKLAETEEAYEKIIKRFKDLISHIRATNKKGKKGIKLKRGNDLDFDEEDFNRDDSYYEEFNLSNKNGLASAASRLGLFMLRDDLANSLDSNLQHAHDYFVLNPCKITVNFTGFNKLKGFFNDFSSKNKLLCSIRSLSVLPDRDFDKDIDVKFEHESALQLLKYIENKRELGATCKDLREKFGLSCAPALEELVDSQYIIRTGVIAMRYVHAKFTKSWVIRSYRLPRNIRDSLATGQEKADDLAECSKHSNDEEDPVPRKKFRKFSNVSRESLRKFYKVKEAKNLKEIEVLIRPWIRVDGTVNRRVLDRLLGSVLGHSLFAPGMTLLKLQERFAPALQPVHTAELALMLKRIGCLHLQCIGKIPKVSIFSRRTPLKLVEATGLEDPSEIYVEPDSLSITKLGLFIGEKAYGEDYLEYMTNSASKT